MFRDVCWLAKEVVGIVWFAVGEYGGVLLDKITGYDYVAAEAEIRESIRRAGEGL